MNPIVFARRRPVITFMLIVAIASGSGELGLLKLRPDLLPTLNSPKVYGYFDYIGMRGREIKEYVVGRVSSYFEKHEEEAPPRSAQGSSPAP